MTSDAERSFVKDLAGGDGDGDDDDNPVLLSAVSLREQSSLPPVKEDSPTEKSPPKRLLSLSDSDHQEDKRDIHVSSGSVHNKEVDTFEIEEVSERAIRTTILKRSKHPIRVSTTYISNVNSNQPTSPTGSNNSAQNQKGCCTIL